MRLRADILLLLVAALWGSAFAAQRVAGLLGSVYFFNAARFLLAGIILLPFATRRHVTRAHLAWACTAGGILFAASALQQVGLTSTTAGNAGFITSLYVVLVPLVMAIGWRVSPRPLSVVAVLFAALGAYLLSAAGSHVGRTGDLLELGGAALWAVHVVLLGKVAFRYDAISFSSIQLLVASCLSWLASLFTESTPLLVPEPLVLAIVYTAVASLALGYTLQIWAQRHTPPTDAAIILSLESVFAAVAGALVLGEHLRPLQILGCGVIIAAVVVSQIGAWRAAPTAILDRAT